MFIVRREILKDTTFNNNTCQWEKCEPFYYNPCGSDYTIICNDLKTVRGVLNRYKEWFNREPRAYKIDRTAIYKCNSWLDNTDKMTPIYIL